MPASALFHPPGTETMRFHRWQFFAERFGWCAMFLVLVFALLGGFGRGWLSRANARSADESVRVEYERFARHSAPFELYFRFTPATADETVRLRVNREFVENVRLESFTPEFETSETERDAVRFDFKSDRGEGERSIIMHYQPQKIGPLACRLEVNGQEVEFSQFIYP